MPEAVPASGHGAAGGPSTTPAGAPGTAGPFLLLWLGQTVSLLGSNLTGFALGIWIYESSGSVTDFALVSFCTTAPGLALAPFTGALVDRWSRRRAMVLSDGGAGCATLAMAVLLLTGRLELWHVYVAMGTSSVFSAFQWPAYLAATTLLVPKRQLTRVAGLRQIGQSASNLLAPALGGLLLGGLGIRWVLGIDLATFGFALVTLAFVRIPDAGADPEEAESSTDRPSLLRRVGYGWRYIRSRAGLFQLLVLAVLTNFLIHLAQVLAPPMVLAFASPAELGFAVSAASAGMLLGGVLLGAWGGPRRRIRGQLGALAAAGLCLAVAGLRPSLALFTAGAFLYFACFSVSNGCAQSIWQAKVHPAVQGRVFAFRRSVAWSSMPLAYLAAGPLADRVFEPLLAPGGLLAGSAGGLLGVGEGRGIALLFLVAGVLVTGITVGFAASRRVRHVEDELPDQIGEESPVRHPADAGNAAVQGGSR